MKSRSSFSKVLIVDSQRSIRKILKEKLEFEEYVVETAEGYDDGKDLFHRIPFDVVITEESLFVDRVVPEGNIPDNVPIIVTAESPSLDSVVGAIRAGAFDFLVKPIDMNYLLSSLKRACTDSSSASVNQAISDFDQSARRRQRKQANAPQDGIIGTSEAMLRLKEIIEKVAPSEARVLITGPNGAGKELVAHSLHNKSPRADAPFVEVNCAAIPSELIESELFGHEKGAFTSAIKQRKGKFEQANGGTLFLDEIGDMSHSAQAKVLRALQENRICRVGSDKDIEVDVRVVAATNKNLREEIEKGNFREDLYHRLSVIVINVPPLVERIEDIPLLVDHFIEVICREYGINCKDIDSAAIEELKKMDWTGNIRELRNVVERLIILCGDKITREDVQMYAVGVG